jgi:hypothetical protein
MQTELAPYINKEILTNRWFSNMTLPNNPMKRILYLANNETMNIVQKYCHNLLLFTKNKSPDRWNQTLEDLCFFSNDKLILGTESHEYICQVFPPDEAFETQLLEIYPNWRAGNDFSQQIKLSDYTPI